MNESWPYLSRILNKAKNFIIACSGLPEFQICQILYEVMQLIYMIVHTCAYEFVCMCECLCERVCVAVCGVGLYLCFAACSIIFCITTKKINTLERFCLGQSRTYTTTHQLVRRFPILRCNMSSFAPALCELLHV